MGSRFRPLRSVIALTLGALLSAGCRGGLPPVPPQLDPANPHAEAPTYTRLPDPYEGSAFEEDELEDPGQPHHHGGHGAQEGDGVPQEDDAGGHHGEAEHEAAEHVESEPES